MITKFNSDVHEKLGYYVYRLVDPRNGQTFYVGKGKGNRVFDHANADNVDCFYKDNPDFERNYDNEDPAKIKKILEIKRIGLNVIHMIQRWGMSEKAAFDVEAAFIDFFGLEHLTNKQKGHDNERRMRWADDLNKELSATPFEDYPQCGHKFILIKITDDTINKNGGIENNGIYKAVRASWKQINPNRANKYPYVLAVRYGLVVGVYQINKNGWKKTEDGKRAYFDGEEAPVEIQRIFLDHKIPDTYKVRGNRNPAMYCDKYKKQKSTDN